MGGETIKAYTDSVEEMKKLLDDGYSIISMAYFASNPVMSFIMEKE